MLQLRKKRKTRSSKKDIPNSTESTVSEGSDKNEGRETESDESDDQQISDVSDSELDINNYYFLQVRYQTYSQCLSLVINLFHFVGALKQPVTTRQRRALLRESGVTKIETSEKEDCRQIRVSRESCGCSCQVCYMIYL